MVEGRNCELPTKGIAHHLAAIASGAGTDLFEQVAKLRVKSDGQNGLNV